MNEHHSKMESRKTIQSAVPRRLLSVLLLLTVGLAVPQVCAQQDKAGSDKTATQKPQSTHPFARRIKAPELTGGTAWLNTGKPLSLADLKGKIVLLDFWTYCCINCIHILPDLEKLEKEFPQLVVVGVHSAKFDGERDSDNIREAIVRYGIEHPVVNDADRKIWDRYDAHSWPTFALIDPNGELVVMLDGEGNYGRLRQAILMLTDHFDKIGKLDKSPAKFQLEAAKRTKTALLYPGKVAVDQASNRLFVADSSHHRVVVVDLKTKSASDVFGTGVPGLSDGPAQRAQFRDPQGLAYRDNVLYVADRKNHVIRKIDLKSKEVSTIAGTGTQGYERDASGKAKEIDLASPWDLQLVDDNLFVAMAGMHQIWKMNLAKGTIGPFSGNGRENILDGSAGRANFAQPSGLATDGENLYVADSEVSGIRSVDLKTGHASTIVGRGLFEFGDVDGDDRKKVRLQHALGVAFHQNKLYVADTYNNKLKVIDPKTGATKTYLGTGTPGPKDSPPQFDEPAGLAVAGDTLYVADTNNHIIRIVNLATNEASTLTISNLQAPKEVVETPTDSK